MDVACMLDVVLTFISQLWKEKLRKKHRYEHQDYNSGYVVISDLVEEKETIVY